MLLYQRVDHQIHIYDVWFNHYKSLLITIKPYYNHINILDHQIHMLSSMVFWAHQMGRASFCTSTAPRPAMASVFGHSLYEWFLPELL